MSTLPLNIKYYDAVLSGEKYFTIRNSQKYSFTPGETISLVFDAGHELLATFCGVSPVSFGSLDEDYQKELHIYYPTLTAGDICYQYTWNLIK